MNRPECGTYAGKSAHDRAGEKVCPDCRRAATNYAAWHRFVIGSQSDPRRCCCCGSVFTPHVCGGGEVIHVKIDREAFTHGGQV